MSPSPPQQGARDGGARIETDASAGWREEYTFVDVDPDAHDSLREPLSVTRSQATAQAQEEDTRKGEPLNTSPFCAGTCKRCSSGAARLSRLASSRRRSFAMSDESMPYADTAVAPDGQPDHHASALGGEPSA